MAVCKQTRQAVIVATEPVRSKHGTFRGGRLVEKLKTRVKRLAECGGTRHQSRLTRVTFQADHIGYVGDVSSWSKSSCLIVSHTCGTRRDVYSGNDGYAVCDYVHCGGAWRHSTSKGDLRCACAENHDTGGRSVLLPWR